MVTEEQILATAYKLFGKTQHTVDCFVIGNVAYATIQYTDFMPEREVRRCLEDAEPRLSITSIERTYSDDVLNSAINAIEYSNADSIPQEVLAETWLWDKRISSGGDITD